MAWDTEGTRRRLKEAAAIEFAEHGPDGTTMARIAERAGINKERLYKYFGDKQALFESVLSDEASRTAHYQRKAQAYAAAQRDGVLDDDLDPARLVFLIIGLAAWWFSVPQLARMLTGAGDDDPAEHARRRAFVVRAAERLALPAR